MTASDVPVGVGGTAPTGDPATRFPAHYRNGHDAVAIATLRREKDELRATITVLLKALEGANEDLRRCLTDGERWEIENAINLARQELDHLKDRP